MNPNTGEMAYDSFEKLKEFVPVPEDLMKEANELKDQGKTHFDLEDVNSGLAKYAKEIREKSPPPEGGLKYTPAPGNRITSPNPPKPKKGHRNKKKIKRDIAKASRKMNRKRK